MRYSSICVCLFLILNGLGLSLKAQDYRVEIRHIGIEDGLLHREVNAICQDKAGFIWMATPLGIDRFDGYQMKHYTERSHGFQTSQIGRIAEDKAGRLWLFGSASFEVNVPVSSIDILIPQQDSVLRFEALFPDHTLFSPQDLQSNVLTLPNGDLVFQDKDKPLLYIYSVEKGFRTVQIPVYPRFSMRTLSPSQTIWGQIGKYVWVEIDMAGKEIRKIDFGKWVFSPTSALTVDEGFFIHLLLPNQSMQTVFVDWEGKQKEMGISSIEGDHNPGRMVNVNYLSQALPAMNSIQPDRIIYETLKAYFSEIEGQTFRTFCRTSNNRIWLGGNFGAYQVQLKRLPFQTYFAQSLDNYDRVESWAGRGLWSDGKRLVANLEPFLTIQVDLPTGDVRTLDMNNQLGNFTNLALAGWKDKDLLKGRRESLVQITDAGEIKEVWHFGEERDIWAILPVSEDEIWLGLGREKGIGNLHFGKGKFLESSNYIPFSPLLGKNVIHIAPDKQGRLWFCSDQGLYRFEESDSTFQYFGKSAAGNHYLPADNFYHFYPENDSILWLATRGEGLIRWNIQTSTYRQFTREDGLPNNTLYGIYEDKHDHLWMPSDYGIIQFNKQTYISKTYLPQDGTSEVEFNRISHTSDEEGRLYFGSLNGITAFHPDDFYSNDRVKTIPLQITGFSQFDGDENKLIDRYAELLASPSMKMQPRDRYLKLEVALLNYENEALNQYSWKIEGLDDDWRIQNEPVIQIGRIPYGNYTLRVKARSAKGEPSANEFQFNLAVVPPFYMTAGFIIGVILAVLILASLLVYYRFRSLRLRQQLLEQKIEDATAELREMDRLKSRLFANVSHELRTPLSLILGPISSVLKNFPQEKQAQHYLQLARQNGRNLQLLITEILDLGKLESGKLKLAETPVNASAFLQNKATSFNALAENEKLTFQFESDLPPETYLLWDRQMVERIINNLLSNAIKFTGEGGSVSLQCVVGSMQAKNSRLPTANSLLLTVTDTGPGIHPDDLPYIFDRYYQAQKGAEKLTGGTGIGLALSKELAELMGGTLVATSKMGAGSQFTLTLPRKGVDTPPKLGEIEEQLQPIVQAEKISSFATTRVAINGDKKTILVVEDNAGLREYLRSLLEPRYHVILARHGREGLEKLKESFSVSRSSFNNNGDTLDDQKTENGKRETISLVLTDLMMPEMDGMALLEAIKGERNLKQLPVIMLTARTGLSEKLKALRLGVHDYLTKPFEEEELLARVENLLEWAHNRDQALAEVPVDEVPLSPTFEDQWVQKVDEWVANNYQSSEVKMMDWAEALHLSESQFRRRLKQATGLSPLQYLQEYRLIQARQLLENQTFGTIAEIAGQIGFSRPDYFSKVFQKRFGKLPSNYLKAH